MSGATAAALQAGGDDAQQQKAAAGNRIQVSSSKKPLFFYVNLAKKYMQQHGDVELSALGLAISTVVTIAEILKNNGLAIVKKIRTSTVEINDEMKAQSIQKTKIEIVLGKSDNFDESMAATAGEATSDHLQQNDYSPLSITIPTVFLKSDNFDESMPATAGEATSDHLQRNDYPPFSITIPTIFLSVLLETASVDGEEQM